MSVFVFATVCALGADNGCSLGQRVCYCLCVETGGLGKIYGEIIGSIGLYGEQARERKVVRVIRAYRVYE